MFSFLNSFQGKFLNYSLQIKEKILDTEASCLREHRKQINLAQTHNFLKTIKENGEKGMTEVTYTGGQGGTTAISDV